MPQGNGFTALRSKLAGADPADGRVTIVAFGDSVTLGLTMNPALLHEHSYHARLGAALARQFPTVAFSTINAGVGGDSTDGAVQRLQRDVLDHHPDCAIVAFGLNDSSRGAPGLDGFGEHLKTIVLKARDAGAAVVLLTPNAMATHDNGHVDPNYRHVLPEFIARQRQGVVALYAERIRQVAGSAGLPVADVYAEWERRQAAGEDMTAHLANGLNHPDAYGHRIACDLLLSALLCALDAVPPLSEE